MGLSLSTPRAAWVRPAAAKALQRGGDERRGDPATAPLGQRAEGHDPAVTPAGHLVVRLVPRVDADPDGAVVAVDGDEREVGARPEAVDLFVPRRRRGRRRTPVVGERGVAHGQQLVVAIVRPRDDRDTVDLDTRRQVRERSPELLEPAHGLEAEAGEQSLVGDSLLVGLDVDALGEVALARPQQLGGVADRPRHQLPPDALTPMGGRHRAADEAALVHGLRREVRRGDHADHGIAGDGDHRVGRHRRVLARQILGELGSPRRPGRCRPPGCRR